MSQNEINNISEVQAQFDGKKYYMPSFYRINLGVLADFMDIPNIPFGSFSAFLHEYIHFLQDVTTMYGMMVLGTTTYYIRDVASRFTMKNCTFDVPQQLTQDRSDYGLLNANLRNIYKGSSIYPMRRDVDILEYSIQKDQIDGKEIERVFVSCIDNTTGENFTFYFGGNILCEGMAYMVQQKCYDEVYQQNGLNPLKLSDYPYLINFGLASLIYPELSTDVYSTSAPQEINSPDSIEYNTDLPVSIVPKMYLPSISTGLYVEIPDPRIILSERINLLSWSI